MKLEKELVAASSVPLVLSILSEGDSYGYAIIQRVKELSGGKIEWTDGMLYPVLHWLEDERMVRSRWTKSESGRKRKYYSLQPDGRQARAFPGAHRGLHVLGDALVQAHKCEGREGRELPRSRPRGSGRISTAFAAASGCAGACDGA